MLGKRYSLGSKDELTGEARVKLANFDELRSQQSPIASFLDGFKPDPKFTYIHVIAMGAGEYYGCNINGDYFPERDLIARHKTFETNAKVFKEHDNKPYSPDYGNVAFSWYNPKMHRVELILALDNVKGKEFIDRINKGEQLEVSMGCKVAYDVCSICGNKAKRRDEYCNHIRYEKKKIYPDGRQPYMINYNPTFFDISIVKRRADRIAYVLAKVASDESSALAEERCLAFENLVNDVISEAPSAEQAVFDWEGSEFEKAAAETKEPPISYLDKLAMIKKIKADATRVMNAGMLKALPLIESVEPDLPPQLLDAMARKFTLADIIKSAMMNAVPLKPAEVTRIIIVQNRMPLSDFGSVLQGVMMARPTGLPQGNYQSEISSLLAPHLMNRSSYLPAIMHRLNVALGGLDKTSAAMNIDPYTSMNLLNPRLTFGYVQQQPSYNTFEPTVVPDRAYLYKSRLATTPVVRTAEDLEIELRRPKLKDPTLNPIQTGMVLGGMYASSKIMPDVAHFLNKNPELPIIAALASLFYAQHRKDDSMLQPQVMQKVSSDMGSAALKYGLPFVGAHLASAHYRNQYEHGHELNGIETFVAENPDILSIAAPIAVGVAMRKHASVDSTDYHIGSVDDAIAFADLMADFAYDRI